MTEDDIRAALDAIQPPDGAQDRMYQNVLKKASQQQAKPKAPSKPVWSRYAALAAMLAVVITAGAFWFRSGRTTTKPTEPEFTQSAPSGESSNAPMLAVSPFEDVPSAADFEDLGFTIDAPENAEDVSYCILDGEIAQVTFTLDGHSYTYRASKLDGDFSGDTEEAVGSISLNAKYDAVLDRLSLDGWRAHWSRDMVSYYLTNFDGAGEEAITAVVNELLG